MIMTKAHRMLLLLAVAVAGVALVVAALRTEGSPRLDDRVHAVASTLRCPVCLNLSAADSPSPVAQEMRATIRRELEEGKTPDQIKAEFVASYGEWILLSPRPSGLNLVAWLAPAAILVGGLLATALAIWRWTARGGRVEPISRRSAARGDGLTDEDRHLLEQALSGVPEVHE